MNPEKCQFKYRIGARIIGFIHSIVALAGLIYVGVALSQHYFESVKIPFMQIQLPDGWTIRGAYTGIVLFLLFDLLSALGVICGTSHNRNPSIALKLIKPYLAFWIVMPVYGIIGVIVGTIGSDPNFRISESLLVIALILVLAGVSVTPVNGHGFELRNLVEYLEPRSESSSSSSGTVRREEDMPKWNFWSVDIFGRRLR